MSDYLSEEEQVARLRSWWAQNGKLLLGAVVLALALTFGWRWYQADQAKKTEAGSEIYAEFLEADTASDPDVKAALAAELETVAAGTAYPALAKMALAKSAVASGSPADARPLLQEALAVANDDELTDLINLRLAKVEQQLGETEAALASLGKVRGSGFRSLVAELKGDIHLAANEQALAHEAYNAALNAVSEGERRPLLALKASTTAAALADEAGAASALQDEQPEAPGPDADAAPTEAATGVAEATATDD